VRIALRGPAGNPRGIGCSLVLEFADGARRIARIESARAYASASEPAQWLGAPSPLQAVEVTLPGGERRRFEGAAVAGPRLLLDLTDETR
jgi:hypothetical protein